MKDCIREIREEIPFNNFRDILESHNLSLSPEMGGNCIYQSVKLIEKLKEAGYHARLIETTDKFHCAVIATEGMTSDFYYLDAALFQTEPINLYNVIVRKEPAMAVAYPIGDKKAGKVIVRPVFNSNSLFEVIRSIPKNGKQKPYLKFIFDLREFTDSPSDELTENVLKMPRRRCYMGVMDKDNGTLYNLSGSVATGEIKLKNAAAGYRHELSLCEYDMYRIAQILNKDPDQIIQDIRTACRLCLNGRSNG